MGVYQQICQVVDPSDWVITGRKHLAAYLQKTYADYQQQLGVDAFTTPKILHIATWIKDLWMISLAQGYVTPKVLLTSFQTQTLWETLIAKSHYPLVDQHQTAVVAQEAWILCQQWGIPIDHHFKKDAYEIWKIWASKFSKQCQTHSWLDSSMIIPTLLKEEVLTQLTLPKRIWLFGIDELNPQYQLLLSQLQSRNCNIQWIKPVLQLDDPTPFTDQSISIHHTQLNTQPIYGIALSDTETELRTMAHWACQLWQAGHRSIGCIIPKLSLLRSQVLSIFQATYRGFYQLPLETQFPFVFTGGQPLYRYPIIGVALEILQLEIPMPFTRLSRIVRSPYIGNTLEKSSRMQLDLHLRQGGDLWISQEALLRSCQQVGCFELEQTIRKISLPYPEVNTTGQWVTYFSEILSRWGWPGSIKLSSEELQCLEHWSRLLDEFSGLELVLGLLDYKTAIQKLVQMANQTPFQVSTKHPNAIHILDMQEAIGLYFNHLWVMALSDASWPSAPKPNPFIPHHLQRILQIPHASQEREYQFAKRTMQRLIDSAHTVILSYPQSQENQPLNPSALITGLPIRWLSIADLSLIPYHSPYVSIAQEIHWTYFQDTEGPPLPAYSTAEGGAHLLETQAICPFKAFVDYRLKLKKKSLKLPSPGLSTAERGKLLHQLLEQLWQILDNQSTLKAYSESSLDELLFEIIDRVLFQARLRRPLVWQSRFLQLEKQRLHTQLKRWLAIECERPDFQITQLEQKRIINLETLHLQLKIDRIDRLPDGTEILIDYKTSETLSYQDWFGPRPVMPQLPLYGLSTQKTTRALAFGQLRSSRLGKWIGISEKETKIDGIVPIGKLKNPAGPFLDWASLLLHWEGTLGYLARQFQAGNAVVDPKDSQVHCRQCRHSLLCRIKQPVIPIKLNR